jgi:ABC-type nickel/cobalt efflux system permease component RcnA
MLEGFSSFSTIAILGLGLLFGLKHATEVDHVMAVSTIVSQHKSLIRSALVGALWGIGHTTSLLVAGAIVLTLRVAIPDKISAWLEFCVALMIIALGVSALLRALRSGHEVHLHKHSHDGLSHVHVHFHETESQHDPKRSVDHTHAVSSVGIKPVLIGSLHGLAGSGALTLLVLTQIQSTWIGLVYLSVFGLGSIVGMLLMSGLIGLPFALSSKNLSGLHYRLQITAAALSIAFGLWYAYHTGSVFGLF